VANIVKITELPAATLPLSNTELAAVVQNNVTKKVALQKMVPVNVANFTGTGSQVQFSLPTVTSKPSTNIYINGVYQQKNTYTVTGSTILFSQAPPVTSSIEVMYA
jgi:hypothetical protein